MDGAYYPLPTLLYCRGKHDHRLNYQNVTHKIHSIGRRRFLKRARLTRLRHFIFFYFKKNNNNTFL